MSDTKTMDRLRDFPMSIGEFSWPSRRWLDEFFRDSAWHQMIKIEECKEGDSMVIRAELPGVDPDKDIEIQVVDDSLLISAEKTEKHEESEGHLHRSEFRYGVLTRSVPIPKGVDQSKITATYKDGVLEIRMETPTEPTNAGPQRIAVNRA